MHLCIQYTPVNYAINTRRRMFIRYQLLYNLKVVVTGLIEFALIVKSSVNNYEKEKKTVEFHISVFF